MTSSSAAGSAVEVAASKKLQKYAAIMNSYSFVPVAFETLGPINTAGTDFIDEIGRRSHAITGDQREKTFLWQRLSMALQRYNAVCFRGTFAYMTSMDQEIYFKHFFYIYFFLTY